MRCCFSKSCCLDTAKEARKVNKANCLGLAFTRPTSEPTYMNLAQRPATHSLRNEILYFQRDNLSDS